MRAPKNPIHPGEILLEEFLKPEAETQAALAVRLGWTSALRDARDDRSIARRSAHAPSVRGND
jgi:plasmid maintenance system antidote protein VapI